jgi:quercetin dioxygenase-like cupin family protein
MSTLKMTRACALIACLSAVATAQTSSKDPPSGFVAVRAGDIAWQAHPSIKQAEFAILLGRSREAGPLIVRVKLPPDMPVMPHTHPEARTYTVLSGEWKVGFGDKYDAAALLTYPAGSVYRLPAKVAHYQATGSSGAIVQIESIGPTSTDFIDPAHAPPQRAARRPIDQSLATRAAPSERVYTRTFSPSSKASSAGCTIAICSAPCSSSTMISHAFC